MKVAAGIVTYDDAISLERLLATIAHKVDQCIVVHARYPHAYLRTSSHQSLKDTQAVCSKCTNTKIIALPPTHEVTARQTYLTEAKNYDYDFVLIIDSDEYIQRDDLDWDLFYAGCQEIIDTKQPFWIYDVYYEGTPSLATKRPIRPRLFYKPGEIEYYQKHYWWRLPNGKILDGVSDSHYIVEGIVIGHNKSLRCKSRRNSTPKYQNWLRQWEGQYVLRR